MPSDQVMHKFKHGKLKSGSGKKVTSRKQAQAILMSEERKEAEHGGRYPEKSKRARDKRLEHAKL